MALNTQSIFDTLASKYAATSESEMFTQWFFLSLQRVGVDLGSSKVGIAVTMPESNDDDIDLADDYLNVVIDGLNKYIQESGAWGNDDPGVLDGRYERSLRRAHSYYMSTQTVNTRGSGA